MCNSICPECPDFESSQKGLEISRSYQIGDRHEGNKHDGQKK